MVHGKSHPTTCHEGTGGVGGQHHTPAALAPGERLSAHCIGG